MPDLPIHEQVDQLRSEGRHEQAFLLCWGFIETAVDIGMREEFKVGANEETLEHENFILSTTFERKLSFLRHVGYYTESEAKDIKRLQDSRNRIVHRYLDSPFSLGRLEEKNELIEMAKKALRASGDAFLKHNDAALRRARQHPGK